MKKLFLITVIFLSKSFLFAQHSLGEYYGGGTIFYIYDNGQHGLIAARQDQSTSAKWDNGTSTTIGAFRSGINASANTGLIIAKVGWGNSAAMVCANYSEGGFSDWYLPSKDELNLMYKNKNNVINLSIWYWSSTEFAWNASWGQSMATGQQVSSPKTDAFHVRAIRAF